MYSANNGPAKSAPVDSNAQPIVTLKTGTSGVSGPFKVLPWNLLQNSLDCNAIFVLNKV